MRSFQVLFASLLVMMGNAWAGDDLKAKFGSPPASARPWVFWFWINGNISKEGITADLEAMQRVGIGGVLWMEVSGPWWVPEGQVRALGKDWHDHMNWAVRECKRLGMEFDLSVDFGYGSGGPHITPELSMQKLYWSETEVQGGQPGPIVLTRPKVEKTVSAWLRPGAQVSEQVREQVDKIDSYKDVAILAFPIPASTEAQAYRLPELQIKDGTHWGVPRQNPAPAPPSEAVVDSGTVMDLTEHLTADGRLNWQPPSGKWLLLRFGHASNYKMTRPCPGPAVGLECDRLSTAGMDAHFKAFLEPIFKRAGAAAGKALNYVHIDSWEAGGQNWTATFPTEFRSRRGYDIRPWLPVLTGRVIGSLELSERFLWDVRLTVSDLIRENYVSRLRKLAGRYKVKLSTEAYGHLCIDNLAYAGISDFPISEFWAKGNQQLPAPGGYESSTKVMSSAAHTYGKPVVGAEAFTSDRGWRDHPFTLKGMGDGKFCEGLNRVIFHLYAHQAYDQMVPGLTHRKWGEHIQRHNTWWEYSEPWMKYLARCQYLLQQGSFVADVCYWFSEGAPVSVNNINAKIPAGYDLDYCSTEIVLQMKVRNGRIVLPSGMDYTYLKLPESDKMTLPLLQKVRDLVDQGARVISNHRPLRSPGLSGYPQCDSEISRITSALWDQGRIIQTADIAQVFAQDELRPDFEGGHLRYLHRRSGDTDIYFVSHYGNDGTNANCTFRVAGKMPELWDPETGTVRTLTDFSERDGRITVPLRFESMQSWFVIFRQAQGNLARTPNFSEPTDCATLSGPWQVSFDPRWGGPKEPVRFSSLEDWSTNAVSGIRYYSGTAIYTQDFIAPSAGGADRLFLDLGAVEVMARVRLNGKDCGIAWKPPYRVDISQAIRPGKNKLEISVVNLWINRMIGDEQLPLDGSWKDFETLLAWPDWFITGAPRPSGRYTFTSARHYQMEAPLVPSGLLGPVKIQKLAKP